MGRREFIAAVASAAGWPVLARAQQPPPTVGFLSPASSQTSRETRILAFISAVFDSAPPLAFIVMPLLMCLWIGAFVALDRWVRTS
jgi:hypothetical protein